MSQHPDGQHTAHDAFSTQSHSFPQTPQSLSSQAHTSTQAPSSALDLLAFAAEDVRKQGNTERAALKQSLIQGTRKRHANGYESPAAVASGFKKARNGTKLVERVVGSAERLEEISVLKPFSPLN